MWTSSFPVILHVLHHPVLCIPRWLQSPQADASTTGRLAVIAHLTPPRVSATPRYHAFMRGLGGSTKHLLCALQPGASQVVTLRRATMLQAKLHCLHPTLFPLLHHTTPPTPLLAIDPTNNGAAACGTEPGVSQEAEDTGMMVVEDPPPGPADAAPAGNPATTPMPQVLAARSGLKLHLAPIKSQVRQQFLSSQ